MTKQSLTALLLDCLHVDVHRLSPATLSSLTLDDWSSFQQIARQQRVESLVYHRLMSEGLETAIPENLLFALRQIYRSTAIRNLASAAESIRIGGIFRAHGIPVIALKGTHLAAAVYDNPAQREMGDTDLMVPGEFLWRAAELVEAQGYQPVSPYSRTGDQSRPHHLPPFVKPGARRLELHWSITGFEGSFSLDAAELWHRASPLWRRDTPVLALSSEDLLLHLCIHASYQHQFCFGLRNMRDVAETIRRQGAGIAWPQLVERANRYRLRRGIHLAFLLAKELVGAAVPDEVLAALRPDGFDESIAATAQVCLLANSEDQRLGTMSPGTAHLAHAGGLRMLAGFGATLLPAKARIRKYYGLSASSRTVYLRYPAWLLDRFRRQWRSAVRILGGNRTVTTIAARTLRLRAWLEEDWQEAKAVSTRSN